VKALGSSDYVEFVLELCGSSFFVRNRVLEFQTKKKPLLSRLASIAEETLKSILYYVSSTFIGMRKLFKIHDVVEETFANR
jgi:hypothetical protein